MDNIKHLTTYMRSYIMKICKKIMAAMLLSGLVFMLSGCLTTTIIDKKIQYKKETYCIVNLPVSGSEPLNANLYDLSHEYNIGIYIVNDFAPGAPNHAGDVIYSEEGYAEQVLAAYNWIEPYDDYVMLAIGDNVLVLGDGGDAFADISASSRIQEVLTDDVCEKLEAKITGNLENAKSSNANKSEAIVPVDDYQDILYGYLDELKPYLEIVRSQNK